VATLIINEILKDFYMALEVKQMITENFLQIKNPQRIKDADKIQDLIAFISSITLRLQLNKQDVNLQNYLSFYSSFASLLLYFEQFFLNNIKSYNASKEQIFYQIFKYVILPFFVNLLGSEKLKKIVELFPTEDENITQRFIKISEIKNKHDYIEPENLDNFNKMTVSLRQSIKRENLPKTSLFFKVFREDSMLLETFTYSKVILYFYQKFGKEKSKNLMAFFGELVEDKKNKNSNRILNLEYWIITETINRNLCLIEDRPIETEKYHQDEYCEEYETDNLIGLDKVLKKIIHNPKKVNFLDKALLMNLYKRKNSNLFERFYLLKARREYLIFQNKKEDIEVIEKELQSFNEDYMLGNLFNEFDMVEEIEDNNRVLFSPFIRFIVKYTPIQKIKYLEETESFWEDYQNLSKALSEYIVDEEKYLKEIEKVFNISSLGEDFTMKQLLKVRLGHFHTILKVI